MATAFIIWLTDYLPTHPPTYSPTIYLLTYLVLSSHMLTYLLPTSYLLGCLCLCFALVSFALVALTTPEEWISASRERKRASEAPRERETTQRHREKNREWDREQNREWNSTERERARGTGTQTRQREKQTEESSRQSRFGYCLARYNCKEVGPFVLLHGFLSVCIMPFFCHSSSPFSLALWSTFLLVCIFVFLCGSFC